LHSEKQLQGYKLGQAEISHYSAVLPLDALLGIQRNVIGMYGGIPALVGVTP